MDDEQVNLTRFDLFFPEKREFFLEKANLFRFGPGYHGRGGHSDDSCHDRPQLRQGVCGRHHGLVGHVLGALGHRKAGPFEIVSDGLESAPQTLGQEALCDGVK